MKIKKINFKWLLILSIIAIGNHAHAQPNVNVNTHTGTASVSVPICVLQENGFTVPVSLGYSASGVRVTDVSGIVGMNWYLNAGGSISREVRGLPDDIAPNGWLHNGIGSTVASFSSGPFEYSDYHSLESINSSYDTDPDIFYINTPYVSGKFLIDNDSLIQLQPYQEMLVDYELSTTSAKYIVSFTITDANGVKYIFAQRESISEKVEFDAPEVYFKRLQEQYGSFVSYSTSWHMTDVILPNGSSVTFDYEKLPNNNSRVLKSQGTGVEKSYKFIGSANGSFDKNTTHSGYVLKRINAPSGDRVEFEISSRYDSISDHKLTGIKVYKRNDQLTKEFDFFYGKRVPHEVSGGDPAPDEIEYIQRTFLTSVNQRSGNNVLPGYTFEYYGVGDYYTYLPVASSTAVDFWGYYNDREASGTESMQLFVYPDLTDENRYRAEPVPTGHAAKGNEVVISGKDGTVNPKTIHYGSLSKINYPTGGNTRLYYEPNEYHDPAVDSSYLGSGIRIYKTITHDGVSNKNNIVTKYGYSQAGTTSGLITERPKFAFATPYKHDVLDAGGTSHSILSYQDILDQNTSTTNDSYELSNLTIRTNFNLTGGREGAVRYSHVEVTQTGKGKVTYDYQVEATLGDTLVNAEWEPTEIIIGRDSIANDYEKGHFQSGINVFPLSYNPNYDFERGLLEKTEARDEQGNLMSESLYEYGRVYKGSSADLIYGLDYEKLPTYQTGTVPPSTSTPGYFYAFGKYKAFSNLQNVISKKTDRVYDPADSTKFLETVTDYTYSTVHKKVKEVATLNSDSTIRTQHFVYAQDYDIQKAAGDDQVTVLDSMISKNILSLPIEQYTTSKAVGESEKIISGSLTWFSDFSTGKILPNKQYVLKTPQTTLTTSSINNSGSTSLFTYDSNYELVNTIEEYDENDNPTTTIGRSEVYSGIHWGYEKTYPHASIANAKAEEVSYSGFETTTGHELTYSETHYTSPFTTARTGSNALRFLSGSNYKLSATVSKGDTDTYILSMWLGSPASADSVTAVYKSADLSTTYATVKLGFADIAAWTYYEKEVDVGSFSSEFVVELTTDAAVSIDDVLLYPEDARVTYSCIGSQSEVLSATSPQGLTQYFEYDNLLRNTIVRDDDKNILSVNEYTDRQVTRPVNPYFHYLGVDCNDDAVFAYDDPDTTGYSYIWYFGDDPNGVAGTGVITTHGYSSDDTYTVRLAATKGGETVNSYQTIEVDTGQKSVSICAAGPKTIDKCNAYVDEVFNDGCYNATGNLIAPTVFSVGEVKNCYNCTNLSYAWEISQNGGSIWTSVGTSATVSLFYDDTFLVRCKVTINCTSPETITSDEKEVYIFKSNPSCPNIITY